ncbi:MAG: alpha-amylase family glycosyl hydrolase [Dokdonia sp.]|jgi:glycosidase
MLKIQNLVAYLLLLLLILGCRHDKKKEVASEKDNAFAKADSAFTYHSDSTDGAVIYEVNIRQYSPEGTLAAFTEEIPKLKQLGVKILWVMPVFPISQTKRKGELGSYYAVSDFRAINPEFGNQADMDQLIETAHDHDIAVILDWVPNHTGWDHTWIKAHPEWYTQNEQGEIIDPSDPETGVSYGWADVADLNYNSREMQDQMIADLTYWVKERGVDGFRMDVAHKVPPAFFKRAHDSITQHRPVFMLAEAEQPDLFDHGFDMHYTWEMHHLLNDVANGKAKAAAIKEKIKAYEQRQDASDINMYFITNHDENSWAGTLGERMGEKKELFTALIYALPGMPLIYSGQEYDLNHRLAFFEKDTIPKQAGNYFDLLAQLGTLKNTEPALHGGHRPAAIGFIDTATDDLLHFKRYNNGETIHFIGNFSNQSTSTSLPKSQSYIDVLTNSPLGKNNQPLTLGPWDFVMLKAK